MKHLTKTSLEQLSKKMPVLSESQQRSLIGGSGYNPALTSVLTGFYNGNTPLSIGVTDSYTGYTPLSIGVTGSYTGYAPLTIGVTGSYTGYAPLSVVTGFYTGKTFLSLGITGFYTGDSPLSGEMEDEPLYDYMMDEITVTPQGAFPTSYGTRGSFIASNALGEEGVNEANNMDKILGYFEDTDCKGYDENTPWCAAFVSSMYATTGNNGAGSAAVAEWKNYGSAVSTPQVGDVAFFKGQSHVGIVTGVSGDKVSVISGNYSDAVITITEDSSKFEFRR